MKPHAQAWGDNYPSLAREREYGKHHAGRRGENPKASHAFQRGGNEAAEFSPRVATTPKYYLLKKPKNPQDSQTNCVYNNDNKFSVIRAGIP
jgi:hypothetical protein